MKINPDDPKWTAYVLGELSAAERAQVEKELESSAEARETVDEIRLTTTMLKDELAGEISTHLNPRQLRTIRMAAVQAEPPRRSFSLRRLVLAGSFATAASLMLFTVMIPSLLRSRQAAVATQGAYLPPPPPTASYGGPVRQESQSKPAATGGAVANEAERLKATDSTVGAVYDRPGAHRAPLQEALPLQKDEQRQVFGQQAPMAPQSTEYFKSFVTPAVLGGAGGAGGAIPAEVDRRDRPFNTEAYDFISDHDFIRVATDPMATFSIDVDTASYANVRRFLTQNTLPPKDAVRIEEMINYFTYDYAPPAGQHPIAGYTEIASAPWNPAHRLVRIGIKGKEIDMSRRPPSNLVFLIDVSGSMQPEAKLPLVKRSMKLLIDKLSENDRVALVVYAGSSGLVLPSTSGDKKEVLMQALDRLEAGGSTNGAGGIQLAYDTAVSNFIRGGINRVVLMTDGDFNVGITNQGDLTRLIEDKAKSGVFLSVLGFGMGNLKDSTLEKLADRGNGNYAYIDTIEEGRKVLVEEMGGTLMTIAKDVKIQVEFNPAEVNAYRLIGYENRVLQHQDFNNDQKDAGDMGAGHTVTALFEVVPRGVQIQTPTVDPLRYQAPMAVRRDAQGGEMLNLKIRYKDPEGSESKLLEIPVRDRGMAFGSASIDFRFVSAVASFGMILRDSQFKGQITLEIVIDIADKSRGSDRNGYRDEFIRLVRKARELK